VVVAAAVAEVISSVMKGSFQCQPLFLWWNTWTFPFETKCLLNDRHQLWIYY
jgi:hypothetical protein